MKKVRQIIMSMLAVTMALTMTACGSAADMAVSSSPYQNGGMVEPSAAYESMEYEMADSIGMSTGSYSAKTEEGYNPGAGSESGENPEVTGQQSDRKLIRTVNMSVETKEYDTVMDTIERRISELGGYIENMESYNGSSYSSSRSSRNSSITVRIPAGQLNVFLGEVSEISNVVRRTENVQDVTLEYVDLESHKKTLQAEHERLLQLMEQAESIEDIITIEQRLSNVQYQLESMEAQLRTYDNKVDYSTVYLDVNEVQELTPVEEETLWERIGGGFMDDLKGIGNGILEIVVWLAVHIPTLVMWTLLIVLFILWIRWYMNRSRRKAAKKAAGAGPMTGGNPAAGAGPVAGGNPAAGAGPMTGGNPAVAAGPDTGKREDTTHE